MNKVFLIGRLTAEPEVRTTQSGDHTVARFTLAVDRRVAKGSTGDSADFIRCQAWDKRAEFCDKYLKKGSKIALEGRIQTGSYKDKDDRTVYTTDVIVENMEFAGAKETDGDSSKPAEGGFLSVPDGMVEELPFN